MGYTETTLNSEVVLIVQAGNAVTEAASNAFVEIVTKATPFYGESGGQAGDHGVIRDAKGNGLLEIIVENTIKDPTGLIVHKGKNNKRKIENRR